MPTPSPCPLRTSRVVRLALLVVPLLLLAACGRAASDESSDQLRVVATTGQVGDVVANIGGDQVQLQTLMGPGIDPHLFVASESDVALLAEADLIVYNGNFLEAQMEEIFEQIGERKPVVAIADGIDPERMLPWSNGGKEYDPHLWFDVSLWADGAAGVRDALASLDPEHAETYASNASAYLDRLAELDAYVRTQAERVPADQRVLVTAHDAFGYFGRAYGFEVRGLQGISTASEAGTADVRALAEYIVERRLPAIFVESSVPIRSVEALQAAVAAQGWDVAIGGSLFSDAMGSPDTPEGTYEGMVRHNIDTIVSALLGEEASQ